MKPVEVSDKTFEAEVLKSNIPVMVDFWAPWCGPCRLIAPVIEELALEYAGKFKFAKVNVDENPERPSQYQVFSIPNLKVFKNGQLVDEIVGAAPKAVFQKVVEKHLK